MSFLENVSYDESDTFERTDLTPYREVFDNLKPGMNATIVVPTGAMYTDGPHAGKRGKIERGHEMAFRKVATERGVGLRCGYTHMPDGNTRLRFRTEKRRQFSPEANRKREASLAASRENKAADTLLIQHPDWSREQAVKHYRTETAKAAAAAKKAVDNA